MRSTSLLWNICMRHVKLEDDQRLVVARVGDDGLAFGAAVRVVPPTRGTS